MRGGGKKRASRNDKALRRLRIESLESRQLLTAWPARVSVPYVDATAYPAYNLAAAEEATGNKYYTLAFIVAGTTDEPAWGGQDSLAVSTGYPPAEQPTTAAKAAKTTHCS